MRKTLIILGSILLLIIFTGLIKVTVKIEGEVYLSCEETKVTLPFKKSISTRLYAINSAKKAGEERAEMLMNSLENNFMGATAEYEILDITLSKKSD